MAINVKWHQSHRMPTGANFEQRVQWPIANQKHFGRRPIPALLALKMKKKGMKAN